MGTVQTNCCKPLLLNTLNGESSLAAKQLLRASPCVRIACDVLFQKGPALLSAGGEPWSEHVGSEL